MTVQLLRHATLVVNLAGKTILVDPMLGRKDSMEPVQMAANSLRIPMVELPLDEPAIHKLVAEVDAVLVTHTHRDHWDAAAQQLIPKDKLILGQPPDEPKFNEQGFRRVQSIDRSWNWNGIAFHRTGGQHGTGEMGKKMAPVSGFVLEYVNERLYIAGDTVWCAEVREAIDRFRPQYIIVNAGAAQFTQGGPITMTAEDVRAVTEYAPESIVVAVHMESVNHCYLKRADLRQFLAEKGLNGRVRVPQDGEKIIFAV